MSRLILGSILLLAAAGCSMGPDYVRPELHTEVPQTWARQQETDAQAGQSPQETISAMPWWQAFEDTVLDQLVAEALVYNNDLAAAVGRVLEARAMVGGAESARWPTISVNGSAVRAKNSEAISGFGPIYNTTYSASALLRYEADLWGKLSRGKEAALTSMLASEQDRRAVAQRLIADVVRTWLEIRELELQVALNEQTVASFTGSLETVQERYRRGLVSPLDVYLSSQNLAAARAAGPVFRQNLAAARRRLEILVGRYPDASIIASQAEGQGRLLVHEVMPPPLPLVPAGLPGDLLQRRPDLRSAELRLHASVARVGEAKAALYPRITLTAEAGSKSAALSDLLTSPSEAWSLVGGLVMPLINRGATKAQIKAAEARAQQATAQYRGIVLQAFSEVENALDQDFFQRDQERHLIDSVQQARSAVELAEERYLRGLDNLLVTLESQRRLYTAESQLLSTRRLRRTARINLIQALGGPWEDPDPGGQISRISRIPRIDTQQGADQ